MPKPRRKQSSKLDSRFPGRGGGQGRGGGAAGRGPGAQTTAPKVEMSARAEARVRRALEAVSLDARSSSASDDAAARAASDPPRPAVAASDLSRQKLARTYDELIAQGFAPGDVRDALAAVVSNAPNADAVSLDASLDWLCFHLPTERLPRRYQGDVRTAADVTSVADITVVNLAEERRPGIDDGGGGAEAKAEAEAEAAEAEAARLAERSRAAEVARVAAAAAAELSRRREAEETARANREWIMRRYDDDDDGRGTDDDWDASSASASDGGSSHDSLEDFGLEPEEIERRAFVRRRRRAYDADPAAHLRRMRTERDEARRKASVAKATRNKPAQKAAGEAVRAVAEELARYGLSEAALEAVESGDEEGDERERECGGGSRGGDPPTDAGGSVEADAADRPAPEAGPEETRVSEEDDGGDEEEDEEEDGGLGLDLFGDDDDTAALLGDGGVDDGEVFELAESPLFPPAQIPAANGKKGKKGGGGGSKGPEATTVIPPKALLQMLCAREGWIAPRYDRCDNAGGTVPGVAYSVTVERSGGSRRVGGGAAARAAAFGTIACRCEEEDAPPGGWLTVNDAQNAAAARALYLALGAPGPSGAASSGAGSSGAAPAGPMPSELPAEFKAAWRRWAEDAHAAARETREGRAGGAGEGGGEPTRDEFVESLLAGLSRVGGTGGTEGAAGGDASDPVDAAVDSWDSDADAAAGSRLSKTAKARGFNDSKGPLFREESDRLLRDAVARRGDPEWVAMREFRDALPIASLRDELLRSLRSRDAAVVCGETGSGKTTQVPQYLLDDAIDAGVGAGCRVICTQPRRVAALTVAERVAKERCERNGVGGCGSLVGHHVRLDAAVTRDTRLVFMTAGVLLRKMHGDPLLTEASHVVLDEIHERSLDGDFLLALLRTLPRRRRERGMPPLKLVVMSATLDADLFRGYLGDCSVVSAPGRTHPVAVTHLEDVHDALAYVLDEDSRCCRRPAGEGRHDSVVRGMNRADAAAAADSWGVDGDAWTGAENPDYDPTRYERCSDLTRRNLSRLDESVIDYDLVERLLVHADESEGCGAFLVFLPGVGEVTNLCERLGSHPSFAPRRGTHRIVPLHSRCTPAEQREAFKVPPRGVRKIVVATNVAETSVTIPDVVVVVDTGRVKERQWDPRRGMASLEEGWVSRAAARQRAGRAGRVRPGKCFALYTSHRHEEKMRSHQVPEMHRVPLTEIVLQIKKLRVGASAEGFLAGSIEPPNPAAVDAAVATLREVGAIWSVPREKGVADEGELTPLGHHLATLPVDCRVAKMLVYAAVLSCLSPALTIAACLSYKSPFASGKSGGDSGAAARRALAAPAAKDAAAKTAKTAPSISSIAAGEQSDHLVYAAAYDGWARAWRDAQLAPGVNARAAAARYAAANGLDPETLRQIAEMRGQYASLLADAGFITSDTRGGGRGAGRSDTRSDAPWGWADASDAPWNADAGRAPVVKAVLCAGLYANVAALETDASTGRARWRDGKGEVGVHPGSLNARLGQPGERSPTHPFLVFHEKVKTSRVFIRDCTTVAPAALLLFGGAMDVRHETGRVCLDGWLWLRASAQTAVLYKKLRKALDDELDARIAGPRGGGKKGSGGGGGGDGDDLLGTIRSLLTEG